MQTDIVIEPILVKAFHLMYDNFPEAVMLIHKSKTIMAVNPAAEMLGRGIGMLCSHYGPGEMHACCQANRALAEMESALDNLKKECGV